MDRMGELNLIQGLMSSGRDKRDLFGDDLLLIFLIFVIVYVVEDLLIYCMIKIHSG